MPDYKTMYHKLFIELNDTIDRFQKKLLEVEEIYISQCDDAEDVHEKNTKKAEGTQ